MGSCPLVEGYIQAGKASRGTDSRLYLPDGRRIPCVQGTRCLRECLDRLPALVPAPPSSVVTSGIFSVTNSTTNAILDIEPSVFMAPVDQDSDEESDPALADPDFQAYIANAWAATPYVSPKIHTEHLSLLTRDGTHTRFYLIDRTYRIPTLRPNEDR